MKRCISVYDSNIEELASHNFDQTPFLLVKGEFVEPGFEAAPPKGYKLPKGFPNCCAYHSSTLTATAQWFNKFPNCCPRHKDLLAKNWFSKAQFNGLPYKIIKCIAFTELHIKRNIKAPGWYKEITDFIEYSLQSFGSPNVGGERYLMYIRHYIKASNFDFWTKEKRNQLLEYIDSQTTGSEKEPVDLNVLYSTFQKWVKAIPNLVFFLPVKEYFVGKVPTDLFFYNAEFNAYLGLTRFRARTQKELTELLLDLTKQMLLSVDPRTLLEKGIISNVSKHQLDIATGKLRLKQDKLLGQYSKGEIKYVKVIQEWLVNEEEYFSSVTFLLDKALGLPRAASDSAEPRKALPNSYIFESGSVAHIVQGDGAMQTNVSGDSSTVNS